MIGLVVNYSVQKIDGVYYEGTRVKIQPIWGTVSWEKTAVLLEFVQIFLSPPPPPNVDNLYNFFRRQNSRFESQFRTKNTVYTSYIINYKYTT